MTWTVARNVVSRPGSIHDDERARSLGFTGGLVGGNVQLAIVGSALAERFGDAWYERGLLTFRWVKPVYDGEEVRTDIRDDGTFSLVKRDGTIACAGWAGLGDDLAWQDDPEGGDPLPEPVGYAYEPVTYTLEREQVERSLAGAPWDGVRVPTVSQVVLSGFAMPGTPRDVARELRAGMNARIELRQRGPMFLATPYTRTGVLVAKGVRGRHAFRTIEFETRDADGPKVNTFRWQIKWVTGSGGS